MSLLWCQKSICLQEIRIFAWYETVFGSASPHPRRGSTKRRPHGYGYDRQKDFFKKYGIAADAKQTFEIDENSKLPDTH